MDKTAIKKYAMRTDYVHEQQACYRTALETLDQQLANARASEQVKFKKQRQKLQDHADEDHAYKEKIHRWADEMMKIDLDDGVKHNYAIFQNVLAKIK